MAFIAGASRTGSHAVTRSVSTLGEIVTPNGLASSGSSNPSQSSTYAAWVASVKNAGGVATALNGRPAARYPATTWVPLVNAHKWPLPDSYSNDGNWGYYYSPPAVAAAAQTLSQAKDSEVKEIPWTDALAASFKKIAVPAVIGAGAVYLAGRAIGGWTSRRRS